MSDITGTWVIDPAHTSIAFSARHAMVAKVRGNFTQFEGQFSIDSANLAASAAAITIQAASIDTDNADRDGHLKSADFLDVEQFPTLTFTSTSVSQSGSTYHVTGDLSIHGITKQITVPFELVGVSQDPWGNTKIGFEAETEISRKDFGLTWNAALETGGVLVSDTIKLSLDVEATKQ